MSVFISIWLIGWLITCGLCHARNEKESIVWLVLYMDVLLLSNWTFILGGMLNCIWEHYEKLDLTTSDGVDNG